MLVKRVRTNDGTDTLYSEKFCETYHSHSGAYEEALKKFVLPSKITAKTQEKIKVLDVCFGLGYNSSVAIEEVCKAKVQTKLEILALENDFWILEKIKEMDFPTKNYSLLKKISKNQTELFGENFSLKILVGDARETLKTVSEKFDVIFFDPFSAKNCPELWDFGFLETVTKVSQKGATLVTYSCNKAFRKNLQTLGWEIFDVPAVGRKSPSTLAIFSF
ncbi:hypothetical protein IT568_13145 [bacterium]|nr:hypothetical protein [bacterium]